MTATLSPTYMGVAQGAYDFTVAYLRRTAMQAHPWMRLLRGQRFPEIGRAYQASGPDRVPEGIMCYLSTQRDAERLNFEDDELAVQDLWGLVLSAPRTRALYEPDMPPTKAE